MTQVFISYSRKDLAFVERLVADLKTMGIDVWYDLSGLEGGARWRNEIQKAIQNSDYVIVVLSPDSVESEWVEREHLYSENLNKKILPIVYRECDIPLSFLNLNYIDVQGDKYEHNFERIARFLNTEPGTSPLQRMTMSRKSSAAILYAVVGVAAVGLLIAYLMFGARANRSAGPVVANTPVQTPVQPTDSPEPATIPELITSTPNRPGVSPAALSPTVVSMIPSVSAPATLDGQAVFLQMAGSGNMTGHLTTIDHALASDPAALVFITSNWGPREVYNRHLVGVFHTGTQWAILNQDMGFMPNDATFNVHILEAGPNSFIHLATSANISENWTVIDNPLASDPSALVFAVSNWSPPDGGRGFNIHPIDVRYIEGRWTVFNQDLAGMREGAAFNILIIGQGTNAYVHTASSANTVGHSTILEDPLARDPNKLVFVMPRGRSVDDETANDHPLGVWYDGRQWAIFNHDFANIPEGAEFNILILDAR